MIPRIKSYLQIVMNMDISIYITYMSIKSAHITYLIIF